jgi:catechol 2,3-dioxygenase-like lactoylglutathione lyase family enzyme
MKEKLISGIQQIGIGIPNVHEAFDWYRTHFGMDIPIFEEAAEAPFMTPYTGGVVQARHAILAINLKGGGGFEIWQYTSREPQLPSFTPAMGDLGIFVGKIKSTDVAATYEMLKEKGVELLSSLEKDPKGNLHFFVKDPWGNHFQVVNADVWFRNEDKLTGGPYGAILGVSDIEASRKLYSNILGYDVVEYDETGVFDDLAGLPGGDAKVRRVLLSHSKPRAGAFSRLLGPSVIELVELQEKKGRKIFENRFWGDRGFIHLCFDIVGMDAMRLECEQKGFPFTVDSAESFDMGEAAGHFTYVEDPDGTLIEFVETHKVPIMKKIGWYLDLKKRDASKPLPNWIIKAMRFAK